MKRFHILVLAAAVMAGLSACGGGGDDDDGGGGGGSTVTISGKITFDRIPFKATVGSGLNFPGTVTAPARQVVVEAVAPGNVLGGEAILASATTDAAGDYSLQVPANRNIFIRAKAQMLKAGTAPTWNFRVLNNTNGDALYALDSSTFSSGSANQTRNLHAPSGWGSINYTGTRAAAPFAILDTMYKVKELVVSAKADTAFPALDLYWSTENRPSDALCPDTGDIVSSLYVVFGTNELDECSTPTPGRSGIYILGNFQIGDTDEFDEHVIAHEAGHYFEDKFSRSDSIGGSHGGGDRLDLRVAFGEGWGNAFGAMALNDPAYRDSFSGAGADSGFNLESAAVTNPGWFSEFSVHQLLWDIFDSTNEPGDTVALGFAPIHGVMTGPQRSTDALTSVFPFMRALKASNPGAASTGIDTLLAAHGINAVTDDFGSTQTSSGTHIVPIYTGIGLNAGSQQVCGIATFGHSNRLSNRRFLRLDLAQAATISISVMGLAGSQAAPLPDPDVILWRRGTVVDFANEEGIQEVLPVPGQPLLNLSAGTYVIEAYEYSHVDSMVPQRGETCMSISVTGN